MTEEQLNEPEFPTQMQIDTAFIYKLMQTISEIHYNVNRMAPREAADKTRDTITELKGDPEWNRHFKKMGGVRSCQR